MPGVNSAAQIGYMRPGGKGVVSLAGRWLSAIAGGTGPFNRMPPVFENRAPISYPILVWNVAYFAGRYRTTESRFSEEK